MFRVGLKLELEIGFGLRLGFPNPNTNPISNPSSNPALNITGYIIYFCYVNGHLEVFKIVNGCEDVARNRFFKLKKAVETEDTNSIS